MIIPANNNALLVLPHTGRTFFSQDKGRHFRACLLLLSPKLRVDNFEFPVIIKVWKPRRLPQVDTYIRKWGLAPTLSEPSVAADGSLLLSIKDLIDQIRDMRNNRYNPKQILKRNMYHLPEKIFPARLYIHLSFRLRGMTGNRLLNRTPSTKEKGYDQTSRITRRGRWVSTLLL